jgi:hypothetical protein
LKAKKSSAFCKKRAKTFALRRGRWAAGGSPCEVAGASAGGPTPASQGKSFFGSFFLKKELLSSHF